MDAHPEAKNISRINDMKAHLVVIYTLFAKLSGRQFNIKYPISQDRGSSLRLTFIKLQNESKVDLTAISYFDSDILAKLG